MCVELDEQEFVLYLLSVLQRQRDQVDRLGVHLILDQREGVLVRELGHVKSDDLLICLFVVTDAEVFDASVHPLLESLLVVPHLSAEAGSELQLVPFRGFDNAIDLDIDHARDPAL